jgi:hypothetical protein
VGTLRVVSTAAPTWEAFLVGAGGIAIGTGLYALGRSIGRLTEAVKGIERRLEEVEQAVKVDRPARRRWL